MSDVTFQVKVVKTRKKHRCVFCWASIPVGELAHFWAGIYDGEFNSNYGHAECQTAWEDHGDEEFMPGEYPVPQRIRDYYAVKP
jgi:hypothetical protein